MIAIQRIVTEWTKRSRGAPGAVRRNAVAEAFQLPSAGRAEVLVHQVVAGEKNDFAVQQTSTDLTLAEAGLNTSAGVRLEMADRQLVVAGVTDVWCQCFTVYPPRLDRTVLRLEIGQWGRWRLNFRLWEDFGRNEWLYQKWVVNVAHQPGPSPADLFQTTQPADVTDDMVQLSRPTRWDRRAIGLRRQVPGRAPG